jgi:hypothetical protein
MFGIGRSAKYLARGVTGFAYDVYLPARVRKLIIRLTDGKSVRILLTSTKYFASSHRTEKDGRHDGSGCSA